MPSAFEPCGLTQLISLRYGAVPIVHETGGLKDTVKPYNPMNNTGTGFSFAGYSPDELLGRVQHALFVYNMEREHWDQMVERGMNEDWSWNKSSKIYMDFYSRMLQFTALQISSRSDTREFLNDVPKDRLYK